MKLYTRAFSRATLIPGQNYIAKASRSGRWVHGQDRCVAAASTRKGLARAADVSLGEFSSRSFISWCTFWRCWPPTTRLLCMLVWSRSLNEEPNTDSLSPVGVLAFLYPSFFSRVSRGKEKSVSETVQVLLHGAWEQRLPLALQELISDHQSHTVKSPLVLLGLTVRAPGVTAWSSSMRIPGLPSTMRCFLSSINVRFQTVSDRAILVHLTPYYLSR